MRSVLTGGLLLALFWLASSAPAQTAPDDPRRVQVAGAITAAIERYNVPGVSIAVIHDYRLDWADGFGVAEAGGSRPVTPTTLFQAASVSKPVTALAALRLVELGTLKLDENIDTWLTSWHIPASGLSAGRPVTLRQLLSHSAGLSVHGFEGYAPGAAVPSLLQVLAGTPPANSPPVRLEMKPGYQFHYSGGGYTVVQQLLIDVTGTPFPDLMRQQVLEPLGMAHSTYQQPLPDQLTDQAARGHRAGLQPIAGGWHVHPEMAAAGLWTTPSDLALVLVDVAGTAAGRNGKLLSPGTVAEMLKAQSGKYGLGFSLAGADRSLSFSHGGSNAGYRCLVIARPATGQGCAIMTNSDTGGELIAQVLAVVSQAYQWPTAGQGG